MSLNTRVQIIIRVVRARPRLAASALVGLLFALFLPDTLVHEPITRAIAGWNIGAGLYLVLAAHMMFGSSHERMRARAKLEDEGRFVVLAMVILTALVSLSAVIGQLAVARNALGWAKYAHIAMAILTIITSWAFTQTMFALHYAHDYYVAQGKGLPKGLDFPGGHAPDYGDFLYFACVIGTSGQTADVAFSSRAMRRVGLTHCVLAYFFNATVLALTINIVSGLM